MNRVTTLFLAALLLLPLAMLHVTKAAAYHQAVRHSDLD